MEKARKPPCSHSLVGVAEEDRRGGLGCVTSHLWYNEYGRKGSETVGTPRVPAPESLPRGPGKNLRSLNTWRGHLERHGVAPGGAVAPVLRGSGSSHCLWDQNAARVCVWITCTRAALVHLSGHHFRPGVWFSNWCEESLCL